MIGVSFVASPVCHVFLYVNFGLANVSVCYALTPVVAGSFVDRPPRLAELFSNVPFIEADRSVSCLVLVAWYRPHNTAVGGGGLHLKHCAVFMLTVGSRIGTNRLRRCGAASRLQHEE